MEVGEPLLPICDRQIVFAHVAGVLDQVPPCEQLQLAISDLAGEHRGPLAAHLGLDQIARPEVGYARQMIAVGQIRGAPLRKRQLGLKMPDGRRIFAGVNQPP